ncbi:MAG: CRISPR-associated endonuclease Cas2 [Burkholderiaceae bacterium]
MPGGVGGAQSIRTAPYPDWNQQACRAPGGAIPGAEYPHVQCKPTNDMSRKLFVVAYDVREPKRLTAALHAVRGYASGGQKSAYECWLSDTEQRELEAQLSRVLDLGADSIAFFPLELRHPVSTLGIATEPKDPDFYYIG